MKQTSMSVHEIITIFDLFVPGNPVAQARPRIVRKGPHMGLADTAPVADYKAYLRMMIAQHRPEAPYDGACRLLCFISVPRPASWPKRRVYADRKPDLDNYLKLLIDCLQGLVITNDSRIVEIRALKMFDGPPGVRIIVDALEGKR